MRAYTFFRHFEDGRTPTFHIEEMERQEQIVDLCNKLLEGNPRYRRIEVFEGETAVASVARAS